jgi:hypothetical protein
MDSDHTAHKENKTVPEQGQSLKENKSGTFQKFTDFLTQDMTTLFL